MLNQNTDNTISEKKAKSEKELLAQRYFHVDNGGVTFQVILEHLDEDCTVLQIECDASYFGYPAIKTTLQSHGDLSPDMLRELSAMFMEASLKYEAFEKNREDE